MTLFAMQPAPKNPVMADVARLARCDASTVSLALRNDRRISKAMKEKVERAAKKLGYKVHPMVAAWVARRRGRNPSLQAVPLAYLISHPPGVSWGEDPHFASIFDGARERVQEVGYRLSAYRLSDYAEKMAALNRVWFTRAVQGVIIGPTLCQHVIEDVDWEKFSTVTIGYALTSPSVHRVTEDHYYGVKIAFEACLAQGHRRIGMAITGNHHALRRERWIGAYLAEQVQQLHPKERLVILQPGKSASIVDDAAAQQWVGKYRPEIILADQPARWENTDVPAMGFAITGESPAPGVHENNRGIGRHAADLLIAMLQRNERGLPDSRQTVLVEPVFRTANIYRAP